MPLSIPYYKAPDPHPLAKALAMAFNTLPDVWVATGTLLTTNEVLDAFLSKRIRFVLPKGKWQVSADKDMYANEWRYTVEILVIYAPALAVKDSALSEMRLGWFAHWLIETLEESPVVHIDGYSFKLKWQTPICTLNGLATGTLHLRCSTALP